METCQGLRSAHFSVFSSVPLLSVVPLRVLQCVNVVTVMPQAFHLIQQSLIAIELALCLLYAPRTTYSSSLEQTYAPFKAFGPRHYGGIVFVHL